jgi:hypothetical protein
VQIGCTVLASFLITQQGPEGDAGEGPLAAKSGHWDLHALHSLSPPNRMSAKPITIGM